MLGISNDNYINNKEKNDENDDNGNATNKRDNNNDDNTTYIQFWFLFNKFIFPDS